MDSLSDDFRVIIGEDKRIALQVKHLDLFEFADPAHGSLHIAEVVEGSVQTKKVGEDLDDDCESWLPDLIHAEAQVDHAVEWLRGVQCHLIHLVSVHVKLFQVGREELNFGDVVERKVEDFQLIELRESWV